MSDVPRWLERLSDGTLDEVSQARVETLSLPTGRLVACDPLVFLRGADPFARPVKAGEHAVWLGQREDETAFAMVRFGNGKIATWEVARCPGEEEVEGWPGYGVDSGVGCFVDLSAVEAFIRDDDALEERLAGKLEEEAIDADDPLAYHEARQRLRDEAGDPLGGIVEALGRKRAVSVILDEKSGANLVAFRTGAGDGVYASFWGLDAKGKPVCLVTDFGLIEPPEDEDSLELEGDLASDEIDEDELDGLDDDGDFDDLLRDGAVSASDLAGLEALAAALSARAEPEERQGPSPLFLQTRDLLKRWVAEEKIELEEDANLDVVAEAFLEKLVSLSGHRHPGPHVAEWLLERAEVADVFASDDELEADLTPR